MKSFLPERNHTGKKPFLLILYAHQRDRPYVHAACNHIGITPTPKTTTTKTLSSFYIQYLRPLLLTRFTWLQSWHGYAITYMYIPKWWIELLIHPQPSTVVPWKSEKPEECTFKFTIQCLGPLLPTRFNFNPDMDMQLHLIEKRRMRLLVHSQTSLAQPLKFGNGWVTSSHTLLDMWLLIHAGIKVTPC